jgi:hypothetical protein
VREVVGPDVDVLSRGLIAMPFIMIVVTTSWAPVFTFKTPGTPAQTIPPSIAASKMTTTCTGPGRKSRLTAAHAPVTIPTKYCPSTPMLNMPPLKQTATARAEKINGVAIASTYPKPSRLPTENRRMAP